MKKLMLCLLILVLAGCSGDLQQVPLSAFREAAVRCGGENNLSRLYLGGYGPSAGTVYATCSNGTEVKFVLSYKDK